MKKRILITYHFGDEDTHHVQQAIEDIVGIFSLWHQPNLTGPEQRALGSILSGPTHEQVLTFNLLVKRVAADRRERHRGLPHADLSRAVLEQTAIWEKRWAEAYDELLRLMSTASEHVVTGLEKSAAQRQAESRAHQG